MDALFWIIPDHLAGRPGPDDEPWDLPSLREAGIGAVLSVSVTFFSAPMAEKKGENDGRMCDPKEFAALDIAYACFPLSDWVPPQPGDAEICLAALPQGYQFVQSQMAQGRRVLVHCSGGNDRTGLFLAYFLVRHDQMVARDAIQAVRAVRPTALGAEGWEAFARQLLQGLEVTD